MELMRQALALAVKYNMLYLRFRQIQDLVFEVAGDVKYNMLYLPFRQIQHLVF